MDGDIQFGRLEEPQPAAELRPDCNRQLAVAAYHHASQEDVPVFIDLDVMRDIESHARQDTSVELGGVLLGGQYVDNDGRPFVRITDSLRAQHYEATRGSFKFTHQTWQEIWRELDQFPDGTQMVGWYHTHPGWGIFLSHMDRFICDHFFNRPLDLAMVIDPCSGERGLFQWMGDPPQLHRAAGFYLVASRHRREELQQFVKILEGKDVMAHEPRSVGATAAPAAAVQLADPRSVWQHAALLAVLVLQLVVLALIAWQLGAAGPERARRPAAEGEAIDRRLDQLLEASRLQVERQAQQELIKEIVRQLGGDVDLVEAYQEQQRRLQLAEAAAAAQLTQRKQVEQQVAQLQQELADARAELQRQKDQIRQLSHKLAQQQQRQATRPEQPPAQAAGPQRAQPKAAAGRWPLWLWICLGGGAAVLIVAAGIAAAISARSEVRRRHERQPEQQTDTAETGEGTEAPT